MALNTDVAPDGIATAKRKSQSAYEDLRDDATTGTIQARVYAAMYGYLTSDLGRDPEWSRERARSEADGEPGARLCDELERRGIRLQGRRILDLGAGLGGLTTALARRGGRMVSIEPGEAWRKLASDRLKESGNGQVLAAFGESLPLADCSVDLIVSLQVLEHVQDPAKVVRELYRVLKPGGELFIAYENYLGFREPHYDVLWLPLLPKRIGAAWLRMRGRNPKFLLEAVTYTTFPAVRREMLKAGFICMISEIRRKKLLSPEQTGLKWRVLRLVPGKDGQGALRLLSAIDFGRALFRTFTEEFMWKPEGAPPLR
jgi:SAM-dependent methyltransferase